VKLSEPLEVIAAEKDVGKSTVLDGEPTEDGEGEWK
jgi:hypothetical protein